MNINISRQQRDAMVRTVAYSSLPQHRQVDLVTRVRRIYQRLGLNIPAGQEAALLGQLERLIGAVVVPLKLMSFNGCGLNKVWKVHELIKMDMQVDLTIVQETKHLNFNLSGYSHMYAPKRRSCITLDAENCGTNHSSGLAIMYDPDIFDMGNPVGRDYYVLSAPVTVRQIFSFTIGNLYCRAKNRNTFWVNVDDLINSTAVLCAGGDLNSTRRDSEKLRPVKNNPGRYRLNLLFTVKNMIDYVLKEGSFTCKGRSRIV